MSNRVLNAYRSGAAVSGWRCFDCCKPFHHGDKKIRTFAGLVAHLAMVHRRMPHAKPQAMTFCDGSGRTWTTSVTSTTPITWTWLSSTATTAEPDVPEWVRDCTHDPVCGLESECRDLQREEAAADRAEEKRDDR